LGGKIQPALKKDLWSMFETIHGKQLRRITKQKP